MKGAGASWSLRADPEAALWRLKPVSLDEFKPGERIVAFGRWQDQQTFVASSISTLIDAFEGTAVGVDGDLIITDDGAINFSEADPSRVHMVRAGERVAAAVVTNLDTGARAAFWLAPQTPAG